MMRRLVERHHGILPLDTVESIWRVIIATFTYVQAPFRVHADLSAGDARDARHARASISASRCRSSRTWARPAWSRRSRRRKGDLGLVPAIAAPARRVVDRARRRRRAEDHRAPAVRRARRPSGRAAGVRDRAAAPRRDRDRRRDLEHAGRPAGARSAARAPRALAEVIAVPDGALRRRGAARLGAAGQDASRSSRGAASRPAPRCAARPSSAATRPAIWSRADGARPVPTGR